MHLTDNSDLSLLDHPRNPTDLADRWILSQYNRVIITVTTSLENYRFDEASRALYEFVWNTYCDWYLELAKVRLNSQDPGEKAEVQKILVYVLEGTLRLLHPLVPFITEELWQRFPHRGDALIVADWPVADQSGLDEMAEKEMAVVQEVVGAIRNIRGTMSVPPGKPADVLVKVESKEILEILERTRAYICELGRVENLEMGEAVVRPQASASAVLNDLEIYVPLAGLIDLEIEQQRLQKEMGRLEKALTGLDKKLSNDRFLENAPPEVVEKERHRQSEYQSTLMRLQQNLEALS
jgi:valyl-tRNA synthetase